MKHRKLFPTSINQTDCPEYCDPISTCPYGCYPYPHFYFFPPPSPPSLPQRISTDQSQNLSSHVIIIVSVIVSFFLLLSYYLVIAKYCSGRTRLESDGQDVVDENQGPVTDHPIWFINTVGLQPSVINKIAVFKYRKSDVLIDGSDCSVCLSEFQEDESLRLLPKCNHAFHIPCIDTWLRSHTNCPLCRAGILSNTWSASSPSPSGEQNGLNLRPIEETQIGISERNGELDENRAETGDGIGLTPVDGERKQVDDSKEQSSLDLMTGEGTQMDNSESNGELGENRAETEDEIPLPHLSDEIKGFEDSKDGGNSMDFSSAVTENSADCGDVSSQSHMGIVQMQDLKDSKMNGVIGSDSISQTVINDPVSFKRSSSYGGREGTFRQDMVGL
ncbi:hypothetical protein RHSIM_Rhsim06G0076900 [Rhododendron simsii]|uniref:RING-type E3 ubiquitin transferase n=1 Tax=Rhododendron simsii TaxID=118357 RepID=A0A834GUL2_RHOSS|nr:hypothetical protein RHSIM_Rhsim06G0076900 [Rhododendron simsii]